MMLSCAVAAGVVFCVAVVPLLSLALFCAASLVVSVLFVAEVLTVLLAELLTELLAEVLAELLTVADIAGVCAPQAGTIPTLTKVIAKRMGVKRNSECLDTLDWAGLRQGFDGQGFEDSREMA